MVDNRSAGHFGIGGSFNFKSGDISGTAARTSDDKMGQGGEYFNQRGRGQDEEKEKQEQFVDRSAQLRASLSSLATINAVNVRLKLKEREEAKEEARKKTKKTKKVLATSENEAEKGDSMFNTEA